MRISYDDITAARDRIRDGIIRTPCMLSEPISEITGADVYVKMDNLQRTGSFKERGARNALLLLDEQQRRNGVVAASAGNHALGMAHHGKQLGIPVTVVMPRFAPLVKRSACAQLGATVLTHGDTFRDAYGKAQELVKERGLVYVHGYDDPAVIAGQGTMGIEIVEQIREQTGRDPDAVVVPIGGAGLIAGIAVAVKELAPKTQIIGVEPERAATFHAAREAGHPVDLDVGKTIADGLATPNVGANAFETANPLVDELTLVDESSISLAVLRLLEYEKSVVEGAGAAGVAAMLAKASPDPLLGGAMPDLRGKTVVLPLCGGNIDPAMISRVIERGLAADGRLTRFVTTISDRPGGLARLTATIARIGASVKEISHDRAFATSDLASVDVRCIIETAGAEQVQELFAALEAEGFEIRLEHGRAQLENDEMNTGAAAR
ncbi:MAG: threonine ammonia-lyase [Phycisphaeraceae bacterium]|nr:MAG: threonine ammonia-lyase [Phycisphaeraceae bacterium]